MKFKLFVTGAMALAFCACGEAQKEEAAVTEEQPVAVTEGEEQLADILEGKAQLDLNSFTWINEPVQHEIKGETLEFTTSGKTDLWMHTMGTQKDLANAPMYVLDTNAQQFSFTVKTEFADAKTMYDQCGPVVYVDENNWLKASVEYSPAGGMLGSVNNAEGRSDWATSFIPSEVKTVWYSVRRNGCDFIITSSFDGKKFDILRFCHLNESDAKNVKVGVYACSPEQDGSFKAVFSELKFTK